MLTTIWQIAGVKLGLNWSVIASLVSLVKMLEERQEVEILLLVWKMMVVSLETRAVGVLNVKILKGLADYWVE
jgi:hypothetical protein